jgi:hypothetical protein
MKLGTLILLSLLPLLPLDAQARPVAYLGGISFMLENRSLGTTGQTEAMATYAFLPSLAGGVHASTFRMPEERTRVFALPTLTALVHRWNEYSTQANLYVGGGYGPEWSEGRTRAAGLLTAEGDAETREYYVSARYESMGLFTGEPMNCVRGRVGFSPYQGEMEGLQAWALLQVDRRDWLDDTSITPTLRLFYRNVLLELGVSLRGEWAFNWSLEL